LVRLFAVLIVLASSLAVRANDQRPDPADAVCPRFTAGSVVSNPPELRSRRGVLETTLTLKSAIDKAGQARYCYVGDGGLQSPTLRVNPGDLLLIHFRNGLHSSVSSGHTREMHEHDRSDPDAPCHMPEMSPSVTNLHFHGMDIRPVCHEDDVIHTVIQAGVSFDYRVRIPRNEPPGLYWYHPHVHGFTQAQLEGGASAAIIVEGTQAMHPTLAGLPERVLVMRDEPLPLSPGPSASGVAAASDAPAKNLSINFVPVTYPGYGRAVIRTKPNERQLWRVVSAAATTILDLQVIANGSAEKLMVVSIDGVPIPGGPVTQDHIVLPPGARAEFVVTTPDRGNKAALITRKWDTGTRGDNDPERPLADIVTAEDVVESRLAPLPNRTVAAASLPVSEPTIERRLYFVETGSGDDDDNKGAPSNDANTRFFITVDAFKPALFDMHAPPVFTVHQGTVEDWIITNASPEDHVFHIHQLHFRVLEVNGRPVDDPILRDTINIPHNARNEPASSVKLRMDFRGENLPGTFIYQCHIVAHGEGGMMGAIQVLPPGTSSTVTLVGPADTISMRRPFTVTAKVAATQRGPVPGGMVQFEIDGKLEGPQIPLSEGTASRDLSFFSIGAHTIRATYYGDTIHEASRAQELRVTVRYP
jgi:FtsP/CotA-like multicopper oxidase with cupredoxin domain